MHTHKGGRSNLDRDFWQFDNAISKLSEAADSFFAVKSSIGEGVQVDRELKSAQSRASTLLVLLGKKDESDAGSSKIVADYEPFKALKKIEKR